MDVVSILARWLINIKPTKESNKRVITASYNPFFIILGLDVTINMN